MVLTVTPVRRSGEFAAETELGERDVAGTLGEVLYLWRDADFLRSSAAGIGMGR